MARITYTCDKSFIKGFKGDEVKFQVSYGRVSFVLYNQNGGLTKKQTEIPSDTAYFEYQDGSKVKTLITNRVISSSEMDKFLTAIKATEITHEDDAPATTTTENK